MKTYAYAPDRPYLRHLASDGTHGDTELSASERAMLGSASSIAIAVLGEEPGDGPARRTLSEAAIRPRFHWGRNEHLLTLGAFATPLKELKDKAKASVEMWAFEQFYIARDAFRRGLHHEALGYLRKAMEGDETHEGYALDFRLHFLCGLIRLGSFANHDASVLDPAQAAEAFKIAARYAQCDFPVEAGWCLLGAGWAAYCEGKLQEALALTTQAAAQLPKVAQAQFQAAKILFRLRQPAAADAYLLAALEIEPIYALCAARDEDCLLEKDVLVETLQIARDRRARKVSTALAELNAKAIDCGVLPAPDAPPLEEEPTLGEAEKQALEHITVTKTAAGERTFFGYVAAEALAGRALTALNTLLARRLKAKDLAEDALHAAQKSVERLADLEIGGYRLAKVVPHQLQKVRGILATAEAACRVGTYPSFVEAEQLAKRAQAALEQAVEAYKSTALGEIQASRDDLEQKLERLRARAHSHGNSALIGAAIGGTIAIVPGGYASLFAGGGPRTGDWPAALMGLAIMIAVSAALGAALGAMFVPSASSESPTRQHPLEQKIAELDEIVAQLRALTVARGHARAARSGEAGDAHALAG